MKMPTDEELNVAIAEWRGWKRMDSKAGTIWIPPNACELDFPNHLTGPEALGNIHEAEKKLPSYDWSSYTMELRRIVQKECNTTEYYAPGCDRAQWIADFWFYHATARQRAIALLRVVKPEMFQ